MHVLLTLGIEDAARRTTYPRHHSGSRGRAHGADPTARVVDRSHRPPASCPFGGTHCCRTGRRCLRAILIGHSICAGCAEVRGEERRRAEVSLRCL